MESLRKDLTYSFRSLLKSPGFVTVAVLTLAVGIGANTTIFSVVNAVLLRPLAYDRPAELVWIWESNPSNEIFREPASVPNFTDWKEQNQVFQDMAAFGRWRPVLTGEGQDAERITASYQTPNLFRVLGIAPALGRDFDPEEGKPGSEDVAILSHRLWQQRYGADPGILGRSITLDGTPRTVIGVMPEGYRHLDQHGRSESQLWLPAFFDPAQSGRRSDFLRVVARLEPGVGIEQARADLSAIAGRLEQEYPETNAGWGVRIVSLHERFSGDAASGLWVLSAAVGFLLLIACANVANLQLARATGRQQEIAIRTALGAGRWRLVRQFLTESVVLSLFGGGLGLLLGAWGIEALMTLRPSALPVNGAVSIDGRVLTFTLVLSVLTGIVFGILPALQASQTRINDTIREGGRGGAEASLGGRRMRNALVVTEVALALLLLIGAGLTLRTLYHLIRVDPGVDATNVLTARVGLPRGSYSEDHEITGFYDRLLEGLGSLPGVRSVAATTDVPVDGGSNMLGFAIEGRPMADDDAIVDAYVSTVTPGYFRTLGIPLMAGRTLEKTDREDSLPVAVINQSMARRHWPEGDVVGERFRFGEQAPWVEIVGVVSDVRIEGLDVEPYPQIYMPHTQFIRRSMAIAMKTSIDPMSMVGALRSEVRALDPDLPLGSIQSLDLIVWESLAERRFSMILLSIFAGAALLLASVGIYGVISYSVSQRTREIGVRMALGARRRDVRRMVVQHGMRLALVGVGIGLVAAIGLTRLMTSLVHGISTTDPLTFLGIAGLLSAVAVLASYLPARRATQVDPLTALRYE